MKTSSVKIPLYFLGERNYVNGLTLFEEMIKQFDVLYGMTDPITKILHFKINRFVRHDGLLIFEEEKKFSRPNQTSAVQMDLSLISGLTTRLRLYENEDNPVKKTIPEYDRGLYIKEEKTDSQLGVSITMLQNILNPYDFIRGMIESNYRYCTNYASSIGIEAGISWAYLKDMVWPDILNNQVAKKITFKNKLILERDKIYIIRKLNFGTQQNDFETEVCFFFDNPNK